MRYPTLIFLAIVASAAAAETKLPLWPEGGQGKRVEPSKATLDKIGPKGSAPGHETFINEPSITVYPAANPNGAAVIVCPGGGYWFLSTQNEGTGVCEWLNSIGVTGILLRYRTPTSDEAVPYNYPVQDLQRSLERMGY
jgi:acetyl esterase/lipase